LLLSSGEERHSRSPVRITKNKNNNKTKPTSALCRFAKERENRIKTRAMLFVARLLFLVSLFFLHLLNNLLIVRRRFR
jgi:hypothetical protein